uniref:NADH-ubiquinone oxidoreductase chain 6 n=1 Tax=Neocalanus cristatus TaxID=119368 RepID=Q6L9V7_NEOCR|nr:NADH dehydrogenase subunits 6 [Neocalanus cristatus]
MMSMVFIFMSLGLIQMMFFSSHPISLGLSLVVLALITGFMVMKMNISWFFYLLVLVFLGGVMILIIYMSTLAANEKFFTRMSYSKLMLYFLVSIIPLCSATSKFSSMKLSVGIMAAGTLYECSNMSILMFLMVYLLLTMICVVKLVKFESGPLIKRL